MIRTLKAQGVAFVYISHRLEELPQIADRITVLRDGRTIETRAAAAMPQDDVIRLMVGRTLDAHFPELPGRRAGRAGRLARNASERAAGPNDIAFEVRAGEIVGIAGLVGAGRTEIVRAIGGADLPSSGEIDVAGKRVVVRGPHAAIEAGIALITEDRKAQGLVLGMNVRENVTLAHLDAIRARGLVDRAAEEDAAEQEIARVAHPHAELRADRA